MTRSNPRPGRLFSAFFLALGASLLASAAAWAGATIELLPRAAVDKDYIRLSDVARIEEAAGAPAGLSEVFLCKAPAKGALLHLTCADVQARLLAYGIGVQGISFRGAEEVRIIRAPSEGIRFSAERSSAAASPSISEAAEAIPPAPGNLEERLVQAMQAFLEEAVARVMPGAEVRVELVRILSRPEDSCVPARIEVEETPAAPSQGPARFGLCLLDEKGARLGRVDALFHTVLQAPVAVAVRPIRRSETLQAGDLRMEIREVAGSLKPFTALDRLVGKRAKTAIRADCVVDQGAVETPPLVVRNQVVPVTAQAGIFTVSHFAKALAPGAAGDVIPVKNIDSGETYAARVKQDGALELVLSVPQG
ncbi:MAG: flagellar basal body P-ring formation chaperone FlgA [Planctomycetota bacterium]